MKKGIIIGIIIVIIGIGILASTDLSELSTIETEPVEETPNVDELSGEEEVVTSEKKSYQVNLSDGIGAGDK